MMKKRVKEGSALLLALVLAFTAFAMPRAQAAEAVDTGKLCAVSLSVPAEYEELKTIAIPVKLYKVASIDESGKYTAAAGFEELDLSSLEDNAAAADTWLKRAQDAAKIVAGASVQPAAEASMTDGQADITDLSTGMYLVAAEKAASPYYTYQFAPYLISLPNNYYYAGGDDSWVYDLTGEHALGLKPEQTERPGSLRINKDLISQNVTMGEKATFVFEVRITTLKGEESTKNVALTFDALGKKDLVIGDIPAGSTAVVKEVYAGAGYEPAEGTPTEQTVTITADEPDDEPGANAVSVSFVNKHDGRLTGGYGVVNHYEADENGQYDWTIQDPQPQPQQ